MYYSDPMDQDGVFADNVQQTQQETQQATQSTQENQPQEWDSHLWGFFVPCNKTNRRIDCWKTLASIRIGRSTSENDIVLPSMRISNRHCTLNWDGKEDPSSIVTVLDLSSNGTFINGTKIGKGMSAILREGNEIGFGAWAPQHGGDDYRYIFRFTASGPPRQGIYAHYDIGHELGHGSFATVRSAISRETGEMYAVKIVHRSKFRTNGQNSKEMFMREVSILERLRHKNICLLKETFQDEQSIYLVLEYIDGGDLLDYIIASGGLKELESQQLTAQLCEALAYIHSKGIAHRDLKPENVLLTKTDPPVLKLADFGLAKAVDSMTKFKTMCGTPCYLAPEVVLKGSDEGYNHLVDSWSLGVIVYSMLSNSSPFIEVEADDIRRRIKKRFIDWTPFFDVRASDAAFDFVNRCLQEDPKERMSADDAIVHPWIAPFVSIPGAFSQSQSQSQSQPLRRLESGIRQFIDEVPIGDEEVLVHPGFAREGSDTTPMPTPGGVVQTGVSHDFEHIGMDEVEEEEPFSQSQSQSQAIRQPLMSRVAALAENDPNGRMQSFELVYPTETERRGESGNGSEGSNGTSGKAKEKRKARVGDDDEHMNGGSDSSLTPVDEEEEEDAGSGSSPIGATKAGKEKSTKKSRAVTDGVRKTRAKAVGTSGQGKTPRVKTRAAAKAGDVEM